MSKPQQVESWIVEPARGVTRSSGLTVGTVVVIRIRAEGKQYDFVLSPIDAKKFGYTVLETAGYAEETKT